MRASTTAPDPPPPPPPAEKRTRRLSFNEEVRRTFPLAGDRVQPRLRQYACSAVRCRLRPICPSRSARSADTLHHRYAAVHIWHRYAAVHIWQVLVAEYIKGSSGISPARATVPLVQMERRARARAAEEAAAEQQQQAMLASLAAAEAQQVD